MQYPSWFRVDPDAFKLSAVDCRLTLDPDGDEIKRNDATALHKDNIKVLKELQYKMWAERKHSLLVVLQAMDTGGKDGAIRKTFGHLNPQGVRTQAFKVPTDEEAAHDFLWRCHEHTPGRGMIQIFNRSHYEEVLVVRVNGYKPESHWRKNYEHINNWEQLLFDNDTMILKIMLNISKEEQKARLQERLDNPERHWKFSSADLKERKKWDDYQAAFQECLTKTSTDDAPWYCIPADRKWYRNYVISTLVRETLESVDMKWPEPEPGLDKVVIE
jgi:PPK2 family polyphosphate:nucleotide phosphotransferase